MDLSKVWNSIIGKNNTQFSNILLSTNTNSGIQVNTDNLLEDATVYSCISMISRSVAQLPLRVNSTQGDNPSHRLNGLLTSPNNFQTQYDLLYKMVFDALSTGNAYLYTNRGSTGGRPKKGGPVVGLYPLDSTNIKSTLDSRFNPSYTEVISGQTHKEYSASEILHLKDNSEDNYRGKNRAIRAAELVGLSIVADKAAALAFKNGSSLTGIIEISGSPTADQVEAFKGEWNKFAVGGDRGGSTAFLGDGYKFSQLDVARIDSNLLEFKKYLVKQICGLYGVPLHMLNIDEGGKASTIEEQTRGYYRDTLNPLLTNIEQQLNRSLLTKDERAIYSIRFDTRELLKGDTKTQTRYVNEGVINGWLTPNEGREAMGLPRIDDPELDKVLRNTSVIHSTQQE
jgi:HK97 family phage portal protein